MRCLLLCFVAVYNGVFVAIIVMGGYFGIIGMLIGVPTFAVGQYLFTKAIDKRLIEKGASTDLEDYYSDHENIHADENAIHQNLFTRIADPIINNGNHYKTPFVDKISSAKTGFSHSM